MSSGAYPAWLPVNPIVADALGAADADGAIDAMASTEADADALGADDATTIGPVSVGAACCTGSVFLQEDKMKRSAIPKDRASLEVMSLVAGAEDQRVHD